MKKTRGQKSRTTVPLKTFKILILLYIDILLQKFILLFEGVIVPHSKSGIVPRLSLLGTGQLGFWEFGKGGTVG
jgi:hypothetical protein